MYVCMQACIQEYLYRYVCMYACIHVCMYVCTSVYMLVCMYVRMYSASSLLFFLLVNVLLCVYHYAYAHINLTYLVSSTSPLHSSTDITIQQDRADRASDRSTHARIYASLSSYLELSAVSLVWLSSVNIRDSWNRT